MSCRSGTSWAIDQGRRLGLSVGERILLIALAERANGKGYCWPGQEALALDTGLTARSIRDLAPRLERAGLLRLEKRGRLLYYHMVRPNGAYDPAIPETASAITPEPTSGLAVTGYQTPEPTSGLTPEPTSGVVSDTGNPRHQYRNSLPLIPEATSAEPKKEPKKENQERKEDPPNPPKAGGA